MSMGLSDTAMEVAAQERLLRNFLNFLEENGGKPVEPGKMSLFDVASADLGNLHTMQLSLLTKLQDAWIERKNLKEHKNVPEKRY